MSELRNMLQKIVNLDDHEKLDLILKAYKNLLPTLKKVDSETNGLTLASAIIGVAAAADGKLHKSEVAVLISILQVSGVKISMEEALDMFSQLNDPSFRQAVTALSAVMDPSEKADLITFVAGICSLDDRFTSEEIKLIEDLF